MFGSGEVQYFRHIAGNRERPGRFVRGLPLRSEHFPVRARCREIVTRHGVTIAVAADPAMSEEIAWRLNETDLSDQENQWAL